MSRSSDARRRYVRSTQSIVRRAGRAGLPADGLAADGLGASGTGSAPIERATIEQLEPRKLLFSVSIDDNSPVDPFTGQRFVEGYFSYFIPYLNFAEEIDIEPNDLIIENFNDEDLGAVPDGQIFDESDILFRRSGGVTSTIFQPNANVEDNRLGIQIGSTGSSFSFITPADPDTPNGPRNVSESVSFRVGDGANPFRLLNGQIEVELSFAGVVVDTYTQQDLLNLGANAGATTNYTLIDRNNVFAGVFDEVRFVQRAPADGDPAQAGDFFLDDLILSQPVNNFGDLLETRTFGVNYTFSGPVGATVQFLDLYGREMIETIRFGGSAGDTNVTLGDFNDDGIPDFNDGIGRINMAGFDANSSFSLLGGTIEFFTGDVPDGSDFEEGDASFSRSEPLSFFDDFEDAGFGFFLDADGNAIGLPPDGPGTVIIGSPFFRPQNDYNPDDPAPFDFDFSRDDQGIFLNDGSSIGQVTTNAILFGSSNFNASVGQISSGYFLGSVSVAGDLGQFYVGTDAGVYAIDPDALDGLDDDDLTSFFLTDSQLSVGRTIGDYVVAGRSFVDITVDGDLSSPTSVPPDDVLVYDEREVIFGFDPTLDELVPIAAGASYRLGNGSETLPAVVTSSFVGFIPPKTINPSVFGDTYYRNDTILNAEYIGGPTSAVVLRGSIGGQDPLNDGEDAGDVYAFAVDGTRELVIESLGFAGLSYRIVDIDNRVVAASSGSFDTAFGQAVRFTPDAPGVYYLVINNLRTTLVDEDVDATYSLLVSGMAPTTFGSYRTGLGGGGDTRRFADDGFLDRPSINVLSGSIGSIRIGTGYVNGSGQDANTVDFINRFQANDEVFLNANGIAVSTPGDLYSFTAAHDINSDGALSGSSPVTLSIGRDLGSFYTGRSPLVTDGDTGDVRIDTGGRIGLIDINGDVASEFSDDGAVSTNGQTVVIRTGLDADQSGDIGMIIVSGSVAGDSMTIDTSATPGAVVGGLLVSQRVGDFAGEDDGRADNVGFFDGEQGVNLILGEGSDIRFVDTPLIDLLESADAELPLIIGQTLELVDDAGGRVQITVSQEGALGGIIAGRVIVVPVDGGEGVAIARIDVNLTGGDTFAGARTLTIRGAAGQDINDVISIGRIYVRNSDENARIQITGPAQIDVWRIDAPEGLDRIENTTPGGDIVSIDTLTLDTLRITGGDLGRTQVPLYGPRLIGPVLGIQSGLVGEVGGALGITQSPLTYDGDWNGGVYRPTTDSNYAGGNAYLSDIGAPFDDALNGVVIRTGGVTLVESNRSIGDVISQAADADIGTVRANIDRITADGGFEGIVGSIYSGQNIITVQVGDGMLRSETGTNTPFSETGIYAEDYITRVESTIAGAVISSNIIAATADAFNLATLPPSGTFGIDIITLRDGSIEGAFIGATELDRFYAGFEYGFDATTALDIREISVTNGNIFGSFIVAGTLNRIAVTNGFIDASDIGVNDEVTGVITADGIRNSTLEGELLEFRQSRINIGGDLERLTLTQGGSISDTQITVLGDIASSLSVASMVRSELEVSNTIRSMLVSNSILGSTISAGQITALTVNNRIQLTSFAVAGPIVNMSVQNEIVRSQISVTGPDGRIDRLTVMNDLDADISSTGRIGTIESMNGSILGSITTTTDRGDINMLSAALDMAADTDIGGDLNMLEAGRNIGDAASPGVVLVRGNLTSLDVSGGRLFSDLRIGGTITQDVTIGAVTNLPANAKSSDGDITVFGRITLIDITGDFDGVITSESGGIGSILITNGSLLQGGGVIANDGGIGSVTIISGHLLGNIYAEQTINLISVQASADGAFGDIGVNNLLSSGTATSDSSRNQLPPGVVATDGRDGPVIASGRGIRSIIVSGGDIIEATIYARTFIGTIAVNGSIRSNSQIGSDETTVIAAGDLIQDVFVSSAATDVLFLAGVTSFGDQPIFEIADPLYTNRAGGTGAEADTIKSGRIEAVTIGGSATDVAFSAGMTAGNDGVYNTGDTGEGHVVGLSLVDRIAIFGTQTNVTVNADRATAFVNGTNVRASNFGATAANADGLLAPLTDAFANGPIDLSLIGTEVPRNGSQVFTWNGVSFRVNWNAPAAANAAESAGQGVVWDAGTGTLILANTRISHEVIVTILDNDNNSATALPTLTNFNIRSNDEASIGLLRVRGENGTATLAGNSNIVIDNYAGSIELGNFNSTGRLVVGADVGTLTAARISGASIQANFIRTTNITGSLVVLNGQSPSFNLGGAGSITVGQNATVRVNIDRSIDAVNIGGIAGGFIFRAGGSLTSFEAASVSRSRLSVANTIGSIEVAGNVFDTAFIAGGDLGTDLNDGNGSSSSATDRVTSGRIDSVEIGGSFAESDLVAGFLRGPDGFFGTPDDAAAPGISSIGEVTIGGTQTGSNVNSESYGILSAGTITSVEIGGNDAQSVGNLVVGPVTAVPLPITVDGFRVIQDARTYTAFFTFNQDIDQSSFLDALRIREVRNETDAQQPFDPNDPLSLEVPTPGVPGSGDYAITYDPETFTFAIVFDRSITDRDLVDNLNGTFSLSPEAGPGVYRFELLPEVLRGLNAGARLDGNSDGFATIGDVYTEDAVVGDAGDAAGPRPLERIEVVGLNGTRTIDFYRAVDLNLLLDSNTTPDGLPEINTTTTIRGAIGDHPDRDLNLFGFGGDKDVYSITLQAGQILRLGEVTGPANQLDRSVYFQPIDGGLPSFVALSSGAFEGGGETAQAVRLPSSTPSATDIGTDSALLIKQTGVYYIVAEASGPDASVFVEGIVPNLEPQPNQIGNYAFDIQVFDDGNSGFNAGTDSGNGTNIVYAPPASSFTQPGEVITIGDYEFSLVNGVVTGQNSDGSIVSTRNGTRLESVITSSIGTAGQAGQPGTVEADVDIFHLNNFQPVTAGSLVTITVKLSETGADLGSFQVPEISALSSLNQFEDLSRTVQFALFETTNSSDAESADLVFSPTDFDSRAGTPNTLIASNGATRYGYDANGDFFISFVVPPSFDGGNGSFAVYLQGAFQADYELQIVTQGTGTRQLAEQNVLIEAGGGSVDWLGVGGEISFGGFDAGTLGFEGLVSSVTVESFILAEATQRLNGYFDAIGLAVNFSTNPADFEFEPFSTVFLTSDNNPVGLLSFSDYGIAERSDPFNTDKEDEAVVFAPAYSTLGFNPSPGDLDDFIDSIANGIGRRVGELVGLRLTESNPIADAGGTIDILGEESIAFPRLGAQSTYIFAADSRELAGNNTLVDDTGFFLGDQRAVALLDSILAEN